MELDALVARYPRLWHVTFPGGWDGIHRDSLLSAAALLAAAGRPDEAAALRPEVVELTTPDGGAVLRDQKPNRNDPAPYLDGITVEEWWTLLNSRSYFFVDRDECDKFVANYLERDVAQEVITLRSRPVLAAAAGDVQVATVSASVFPRATGPVRGPATFQPLDKFSGVVTKIKEVTVTTPVTIPDSSVVSVVRMEPASGPARIWPPVRASV